MKFLVVLIFISVFNLQASDTSSGPTSSSSSAQARKNFAQPVGKVKVSRRFKPTLVERPKIMPVTATKPSSFQPKTPVVKPAQPRRSSSQAMKPKIYFDNQVDSDLMINWLGGDGEILNTIKIPKKADLGVVVPDNVKFFYIANNTEALKSVKLRIADNTIYAITCASFSKSKNCKKLQVESSKKIVSKRGPSVAPAIKTELPKISGSVRAISLINQTNGALEIAWLTVGGKLISKDKILTGEAKVYKIPNKAMKFNLIRGSGALTSNTIGIKIRGRYAVKCLPSNHYCNQIRVEKI